MAESSDALLQILATVADTQKKTVEALEKLQQSVDKLDTGKKLEIDPAKLVASTKGVEAKLTEVQPADPNKPNLIEPIQRDQYGNIVPRPCWKCGQYYQGLKHC